MGRVRARCGVTLRSPGALQHSPFLFYSPSISIPSPFPAEQLHREQLGAAMRRAPLHARAPDHANFCVYAPPPPPLPPPSRGPQCSDHCSTDECYQGDVDALLDYGFDSVKLDGCGQQRDLQKYADLFNASGKSILIESA